MKYQKVYLLLIILFTALLYQRVSSYDFLSFDDNVNVTNNEDVKDLSWNGIKKIFLDSQNKEELKPPLTILSFAVNYHFSEYNPKAYHITNLILHLINTLLVLFLICQVTKNQFIVLFTTAIFALHPANSEVVIWVTGRKDLLSTFFYLIALIFSLKYWKTKNGLHYILILLFFILAYYSKYAAASFPLLYVCLAIFYQKRNYLRTILESIPLFLLPFYNLYSSLKSTPTQTSNDLITVSDTNLVIENASKAVEFTTYYSFSFFQKLLMGSYSLFHYLFQFIWPFNQQLIYPYPSIDANGNIPTIFFICFWLMIICLLTFAYLVYKNRKQISSEQAFGFILFIIPTLLLLHILPIGGQVIVADRYTYISYIGLGILFCHLLFYLQSKFKLNQLFKAVAFSYIFLIGIQLNSRIPDWKNDFTIFSDLVDKNVHTPIPHHSLGNYYLNQGNSRMALKEFNQSLEINPSFLPALNNRGSLLINLGNYNEALNDFYRIFNYDEYYESSLFNAGFAHERLNNIDSALYYYHKIPRDNKSYHLGLNNAGLIYLHKLKDYQKSINCFRDALEVKPDDYKLHFNLGLIYKVGYNDLQNAYSHFKKTTELNPDFLNAYLNIAKIYQDQNSPQKALELYQYILSKNINHGHTYLDRAIHYLKNNDLQKACSDLNMAMRNGVDEAKILFRKNCN